MLKEALRISLACLLLLPAAAQRIDWTPLNEPGVGGALTSLAISPFDSRRVLAGGDMLGAAYSDNGGETWQVTTGFSSWELADFTFHPEDPNEVWAGTMSGPYVSRDGGRTWQAMRNGFPPVSGGSYSTPVQKVLFDARNPKRLLAFGGSHRRWSSPGQPLWGVVWESLDGGETWSQLTRIGAGTNVTSAVRAAGVIYVSTYGEGAFTSIDGGASWAPCGVLPNNAAYQIALSPEDPATVWVALDNAKQGSVMIPGSIYKSTDGCATWSDSGKGLPRIVASDSGQTSRYFAVAVAPSNSRRLYTADRSFGGSSLWRSDDGGESWQAILTYANRGAWPMPYGTGPTADWIAVDPKDPDTVLFGNQANIIRTADGGQSFEDLGAKLVSRENKQWTGRGFSGLVAVNFRFNPFRAGHAVFNAMDDGKLWISDDNLASWWYAGPGGVPAYGGGNDAVFAGPDGNTIYTSFGQDNNFQGLAKSTDGGHSWTMLWGSARGLPERNAANSRARGLYAIPDQPDIALAVIGTRLYVTLDGGAYWYAGLDAPGLSWIAGSGHTIYVSGTDGVYRSEDGWNFSLMPGSPRDAWRLALDPRDPGTLYVTKWRKTGGGLWRYRNNEWTRLHQDYFIYDMAVDPFDSSRLVFCTSDDPYHDVSGATGVYMSEDGGVTWSVQNEGLAMLRGLAVRFDPHHAGRLVLGTSGRGYFLGTLRRQQEQRLLAPPPLPRSRDK